MTPWTAASTFAWTTWTAGAYSVEVDVRSAWNTGAAEASTGQPFAITARPRLGSTFYVSPTGTSRGDGSESRPWSLRYAIAGACKDNVLHGDDTVIVKEGTYRGHFWLQCAGTDGHPIIYRAEPGKRVTLDGNFTTTLTANLPSGSADDFVDAYLADYSDFQDAVQLVAGSATGHGQWILSASMVNGHVRGTRSCPFDTPCASLPAGSMVWVFNVDVLLLAETAHDVWVWGFEVTDSGTDYRVSTASSDDDFYNHTQRRRGGINNRASRSKIIDCIVHDAMNNVFTHASGADQEYSGVVTFNSGWLAPDRGHGHGWYIQHDASAGELVVRNSIALNAFGLLGQVYSSGGAHGNMRFERNVFAAKDPETFAVNVNTGWLFGGGATLTRVGLAQSHVYGRALKIGYGNYVYDFTLDGNTFRPFVTPSAAGLYIQLVKGLTVSGNRFWGAPNRDAYLINLTYNGDRVDPRRDFSFTNNEYHASNTNSPWVDFATSQYGVCGGFWWNSARPGYGYCAAHSWTEELGYDAQGSTFANTPPAGARVTAWVDPYDSTRYTVVAYNFDGAASVALDVSTFGWQAGQRYRLRNAANYYGDVVSGIYDGSGRIMLPMTGHTVATPNGFPMPLGASTFPEFGVFIAELF